MRVVIQRVLEASVSVEEKIVGEITSGLLVLLGIEDDDNDGDIDWLTQKIIHLRIFNDDQHIMNRSLTDVDGDLLVVSQFTLHASTKKGNRPSYIRASKPDVAVPLYEKMIISLEKSLKKKVQTGVFGADMQVRLVNDGPVTIIIDTKRKE